MLWLRVGMTFARIGWRVVDPLRRVLVAVMKATFISVGLEVLWMVAFKSSLNGGLQKDMLTSQFLRLTDVTLFWKKCHRKCKSRTLRQRLSWTMWVDPKSLWCFFMREREREVSNRRKDTENKALWRHRGWWNGVATDVKKCQWPAETGSRKDSSPGASWGSGAVWKPWVWTSGLQECEKIVFYCLKHQVCGIVYLQWPQETNTETLTSYASWIAKKDKGTK